MAHSNITNYKNELVSMSIGCVLSLFAWTIRHFLSLEPSSFLHVILTVIILSATAIGVIGGVLFFAKFIKEPLQQNKEVDN